MTEIIYVLLVGYAGYVIYTAMSDESITKKSEKPSAVAFTAPPPLMPNIESKLLVKPETISKVEKTDDQSSKTAIVKKGLKNPKTGEVASSYANYRVMKRWIKEILVSEGLLEKIYKNNELTPDIEAKIKNAIIQLEQNETYRA